MREALFLGGLSFLLAVMWGGPFAEARGISGRFGSRDPDTPGQAGTPTMGSLMIIASRVDHGRSQHR
jgi:UDP-N-acetylmuramyl pentapeptide phosphotransferase/UDP-N-acetylglucosamine-1-phosphate transferase